jgi:hypothetical protein
MKAGGKLVAGRGESCQLMKLLSMVEELNGDAFIAIAIEPSL